MNVISVYTGYIRASTGVSSVIKSLNDADWKKYSLKHLTFSLDQKDLPYRNMCCTDKLDSLSYHNILMIKYTNVLSLFRLQLWRSAVNSKISALLYYYMFHHYRAKKLIHEFSSLNIDVKCLIVHDIWSLIALSRTEFPLNKVIFVIHGSTDPIRFILDVFPKLQSTSYISKFQSDFEFCISKVKSVVVLSEVTQVWMRTRYYMESKLIYNGIGELESPMESATGLTIHITGTLCSRKRQYLIIEAAAKLGLEFMNKYDVTINCFGDGPDYNQLKRLIAKYDLQKWITLHGDVHDPFRYYKAGDLILCVSTEEGLPVALIEGLRSGCIPIVTDVGGCYMTVSNNNGVLISENTDNFVLDGLITSIRHLENIDKRMQLAQLSLQLFEAKFVVTQMVGLYAKEICS